MTQRRVDHPGNVRQKYVYVLVGTGSNEQDITGDVMMIRRISACVHSRNYASDDVVGEITDKIQNTVHHEYESSSHSSSM